MVEVKSTAAGTVTNTITVLIPDRDKIKTDEWISSLDGLFRYKLDSTTRCVIFRQERANDLAWTVDSVDLAVSAEVNNRQQEIAHQTLLPLTWGRKSHQMLQAFKSDFWPLQVPPFSTSPGCTLNFLVHLSPSVEHFGPQLRDSLYADQLWNSAVDKKWTDVEFQIGDRIFAAHQSLLAARCPALLDSKEHNLSPSTFEQLLYFIYTGLLHNETEKSATGLQKFLRSVEMFKVETLVELRRATLPPQIDDDVLSEALLSIFT